MDNSPEFREFRPLDDGPNRQNVACAGLKALVDRSADGMCLVDPGEWDIFYANSAFLRAEGHSASLSSKRNLVEWLPNDQVVGVLERLTRVANGEFAEATFSGRFVTPSGDATAAEFQATRVDAAGQTLLAIIARTAPEPVAAARFGVQTDPLTGLADRAFLMERLTSLVEGERLRDRQCAVLFVDVDGFKQVNDVYGHLVGDRVLCELARRLSECVRSDDHVGRFGGDEFVVLLENVSGRREIQPVVDRISAAFARPVELPQGSVTLAVSVGVATAGPHVQTAEQLLDLADRAMYAAKRAAT